jgi:flavin reductase (DIM6/NTAB) family NADH-FMN oxidoreductase RutF
MLITRATTPSQPRVTALLSCQQNLMPLSWHMPISREPFRYAIAMRDENITHQMLPKYGSFTLNFLPFSYHEKIDQAGRFHGDTVDKLKLCELVSSSTDQNGNLILDDSDFVYECTIIDTYQNGDHTIFISEVTQIWVQEDRPQSPTLFLGRGQYTTTMPFTQIKKP